MKRMLSIFLVAFILLLNSCKNPDVNDNPTSETMINESMPNTTIDDDTESTSKTIENTSVYSDADIDWGPFH